MGVIVKQLLAGRDFALDDPFAVLMANFAYLVADETSKECLLIDPAWDVPGILEYVNGENLKLHDILITHCHHDHLGGDFLGFHISGSMELASMMSINIHVSEYEIERARQVLSHFPRNITGHKNGDRFQIGGIDIKVIHTPGHSPGSVCYLIESYLFTGDTLFVSSCGRVDLPGSDSEKLYNSLNVIIGSLPEETIVLPGHHYGEEFKSTIKKEKNTNPYLRLKSLEEWSSFVG